MKKMLVILVGVGLLFACEEAREIETLGTVFESATYPKDTIDGIRWGLTNEGKDSRAYYYQVAPGQGAEEYAVYIEDLMDKPRECIVNDNKYYLCIQYQYGTPNNGLYYLRIGRLK